MIAMSQREFMTTVKVVEVGYLVKGNVLQTYSFVSDRKMNQKDCKPIIKEIDSDFIKIVYVTNKTEQRPAILVEDIQESEGDK